MAREITTGWETGNIVAEGYTGTGSGTLTSTTSLLHKDRDGNGGSFALQGAGGTNVARNRFQQTANVRALVECWDRVEILANSAQTGRLLQHVFYSGATELGSVSLDTLLATVAFYTSTATLAATSASGV